MSEKHAGCLQNSVTEAAALSGGDAPPPGGAKEREKTGLRLARVLKWVVSFPAMLGTILVARVFYEARTFFVDPDVWWHIKVGQEILRTRHWPTADPYSYTAANTPWIAYEWLGEVVLGWVAKYGGITGLFFLLAVTASAVLLALYGYATLRSGNSKAAFIPALVLASLAFLSFTLRPQMFGYLFLVLTLIVLEKFRQGVSWPLWTLPAIFLAWVNTHGSFIVGIGVVAVYLCAGLKAFEIGDVRAVAWSAKQRIQLELALLFSLAVLPITPYGSELAVYPFDMMFSQPLNVANIQEWESMPFNQPFGKYFLGLVVLLVMLQMLFRFRHHAGELALAFGGTMMACLHARMVLIFVPFFIPIFATMLARWIPAYKPAKDKYLLNAAVMAGLVVAIIHYLPTREFLQKKINADFPVQAVSYLDQHSVPGPMLNTYYFGGYLVGTGRKVFIDGRGDLYERSGVLLDDITVTQIKAGAYGVLDRYGIASCLLLKDEPLATALAATSKWKAIYRDNTSVIFIRSEMVATAQNGAL